MHFFQYHLPKEGVLKLGVRGAAREVVTIELSPCHIQGQEERPFPWKERNLGGTRFLFNFNILFDVSM